MHKNAEILKAIADGLPLDKVQLRDPFSKEGDVWQDLNSFSTVSRCSYMGFLVSGANIEFRIKPEPKPDVVSNYQNYIYSPVLGHSVVCDIAYTFCGETGEVKNIEMLKK